MDATIHEDWTTPGPGDVTHPGLDGLEQGAIYTIRGFYLQEDIQCILLEEIIRDYVFSLDCEVGFSAARFRPIVKTDISSLEEIARKITEPAPPKLVEA